MLTAYREASERCDRMHEQAQADPSSEHTRAYLDAIDELIACAKKFH